MLQKLFAYQNKVEEEDGSKLMISNRLRKYADLKKITLKITSLATANNLKRLAEEFGPEWSMQHIIPQVLDKINNPHYLYRMTILHAISLRAPVMGANITCEKLLPTILTASKDRVPNIKFNVAKVLQSLVPIVDHLVVEQTIKPCIVDLSEDPDVDIRYFASQALQACDSVVMSS